MKSFRLQEKEGAELVKQKQAHFQQELPYSGGLAYPGCYLISFFFRQILIAFDDLY